MQQAEPFSREELRAFLARNGERLEQRGGGGCAASRRGPGARVAQARASLKELLPADWIRRRAASICEDLERRLSAILEEKLTAALWPPARPRRCCSRFAATWTGNSRRTAGA